MPDTNRLRMTAPLVNSRAKAEQLLGEIATLTLERNSMTIAMDTELTSIRETHRRCTVRQPQKALVKAAFQDPASARWVCQELGHNRALTQEKITKIAN
jgi:hypothetical protein